MKAGKLRELSEDELRSKETELKDKLFKLRFQHSLGQLDSPMKLKNIRKDIARLKTILREKSKGME